MNRRSIGRLGREVSEIGFGAWQIGGDWGSVDEDAALATLHAAADAGVTFFDTADVYGDGRSERLVGRLRRERAGEDLFVATKMGGGRGEMGGQNSPPDFPGGGATPRGKLRGGPVRPVLLELPPDRPL